MIRRQVIKTTNSAAPPIPGDIGDLTAASVTGPATVGVSNAGAVTGAQERLLFASIITASTYYGFTDPGTGAENTTYTLTMPVWSAAGPWYVAKTHNPDGTVLMFTASAAAATTDDYPDWGSVGIHKNTATGAVHLIFNDGGTLKSVALT